MATPVAQATIKKVLFNIASKINGRDVQVILQDTNQKFPPVIKEGQTIRTGGGHSLHVKEISPADATYTSEGTIYAVTFTRRKIPFNLLVAVDSSFSMKKAFDEEHSRIDLVTQALFKFFEENAGSKNNIGYVSYGLDWNLHFEPGRIEDDELRTMKEKFKEISLSGRASPSAAMSAAIEIFEGEEVDFLKRLVLFSDGVDKLGQDSLELLPDLRELGIIVDTVFLGKPDDLESQGILREIAAGSRGSFISPGDSNDLEDFLRTVSRSITIPLGESRLEDDRADEPVFGGAREDDFDDTLAFSDENINKEDTVSLSGTALEGKSPKIPAETTENGEGSGEPEDEPSEIEDDDDDVDDVIMIGRRPATLEVEEQAELPEDSKYSDAVHQSGIRPQRFIESLKNLFEKLLHRIW